MDAMDARRIVIDLCAGLDVDAYAVLGRDRTARVVVARRSCMRTLRGHGLTYAQIAAIFRRTRWTARHIVLGEAVVRGLAFHPERRAP